MNVFLWVQRQDRFLIISQKLEAVSRSRQLSQYLLSQFFETEDSIELHLLEILNHASFLRTSLLVLLLLSLHHELVKQHYRDKNKRFLE